jgi:hypothetical protein
MFGSHGPLELKKLFSVVAGLARKFSVFLCVGRSMCVNVELVVVNVPFNKSRRTGKNYFNLNFWTKCGRIN